MSLATRTIGATFWAVLSTAVAFAVIAVRSILLARAVPVETFGVYALAAAIVMLTGVLAQFGLGPALVHRSAATEVEETAAATHFTLSMLFALAFTVVMTLCAYWLTSGALRSALIVMALSHAALQITGTARNLLTRRVLHRRLSALRLADAFGTTAVSLLLAYAGLGLWALLSVPVIGAALALFALLLWRPVWRPALRWRQSEVGYFLHFGARAAFGQLLQSLLQRVDVLWLGVFANAGALGFYSRGKTYAGAAATLVSGPLSNVIGGTYAALKQDQPRLSRSFLDVSAVIVPVCVLLVGVLIVAGQPIIVGLIGARWEPMFPAFQILLLAAALTPLTANLVQLLLALGHPEAVIRVHALQLLGLLVLLPPLQWRLGLTGMGVGVVCSAALGLVLLVRVARARLDLRYRRVFLPTAVALVAALAVERVCQAVAAAMLGEAPGVLLRALGFVVAFGLTWALIEREQIKRLLWHLGQHLADPEQG